MPILFIHGVNNRIEDASYNTGVLVQSGFIARHLSALKINGKTLEQVVPVFPYWGKLGINFHWQMASLPGDGIDALGPSVPDALRPLIASLYEELGNTGPGAAQPLLTVARTSLPKAVRALSEVLVLDAARADGSEIAEFVQLSQIYADHHDAAWLGQLSTDQQFLDRLLLETRSAASTVDVLGGPAMTGALHRAGDKIKQALAATVAKIGDKTGDLASTALLAWSRRSLNANIGRFMGDVFAYIDTRGDSVDPGPIPTLLLAAIDRAVNQAPDEPLVVIGHSLGGVIAFDLFSHFRPHLVVDAFVSVGSQVSHFEEIKRFKSSNASLPSKEQPLAHTPDNIRHWINIFDPVDVFSYACAKVFDRVEDYNYDTKTHTLKAHGAYFAQNAFYERLRERLGAHP
jgi:hypothetical protein